ncbi:MAG: NADH-quinone oxidoreductase subunit L [Dehalococcoidales bacterium]|jgi:NADH-quinone oxidoreductase subunit L|nr:NADH-quinone oxidoreductase subunit L [Dehalococcoidales bacterium]MDP6576485.1 NADH-quinone oxidoreductase subunit L [Dehalococcoidales bacterium]MDP6824762.1 NADH-quinone oxidoreductase subunit L [Dehalococcoidales bacterium]
MITPQFIWLIFLLPVFSFIIISFFVRPFVKAESRITGYILITALFTVLALSIWTLLSVMAAPHHEIPVPDINWVVIEGGVTIHLGLIADSLTAVMLIVVTLVSLMVQIYSQGYMHGDPGYHRYFAWMSLFTASMLGLVLADNLLFLFVFWELVGLCSYLLIGFWFHKPEAADAAKKAFIVTRLGDFGFLAGILLLYLNTSTFDIHELHKLAITGALASAILTWSAIGIFAGAVGKSAQFPLHIWLPDAMEGPTPVSALIHAATMVAAGVFLVARMFPLFEHSTEALTTVAVIGGVTAIFAASMGLVMNDIKRVLAYSTVSQLGYMMLGLGVGGVAIGIFHLFNHAFFKALLFLGAGSINHATGTFDMRLMGGLRRVMPWTYATFVIASLSIAGIWPLSGFWSKDEIVVSTASQPVLFSLAMITVFMTSFYMFRAVFITFGGDYRGGSQNEHGGHGSRPHESPKVMVTPMVVLAILAVVSGLWNVTGHFGTFMGHGQTHSFTYGFFHPFTQPLPWISLILAGLGILLAYAMYSKQWLSPEKTGNFFKPLYTLFYRKYWFDELYENIIVRVALVKGLFGSLKQFDNQVVDGAINGVARGTIAGGRAVRRAQTGQLQLYGLFIGIGILALVLVLYFAG